VSGSLQLALPKVTSQAIRSVSDLALARGVKEGLLWFQRERQWINERHLEVCRIPAPTFFEEKRAAWVAAQFRALGCESKIDRAGNVIAWLGSERETPLVALTAHLDTVLSPRNGEEIRVGPDGRFYGPGVADNGAGLAALLAIAAAMKATPSIEDRTASLVLVANVGEEGEGNLSGMRHLCRQSSLGSRIRSYLILDGPSTEHITCQALASRRYEIAYAGPGGHSWSDFGNGNPVHALSRAIAYFLDDHPFSTGPRSSFNFGSIEGGVSVNSIPTVARAKLDIRSESVPRLEEMSARLSEAVEHALEIENDHANGGRVTAKIREIGSRPGGSLPDGASILGYVRAVDAQLGIRSRLDCASTDANIPLSMGLDAVSIGAGGLGGGAHTPGEWFDPDGRELGLRRILLALCLLLREPGPA
jgi:tripeptide aminopeptidase